MKKVTRREFLGASLASLAGLTLSAPALASLTFIPEIDNPLSHYPARDWEKIYRDLFKHDTTYHFLCAPNDTHNCLLKAFVKNGVITRIGPSYGYGQAKDLYGNQASSRWEPRICNKGLALTRRVQGPRRIKYPMVREGFKKWVEDGFPREADGQPPKKYFNRAKENFIRVSWDEVFEIAAKALVNIATTYSGEKGQELLRKQGHYDPSTIEATQGAGTQVLKFRGGMPLLGVTRILGMYRLANSMVLLDRNIRKDVPEEKLLAGRGWDNYTFHTDLPPGHPMVTGMQTVEFDLCCTDYAKLIIPWGMNWISTKMPDAHWLTEARIKGSKVITVTVEYSSTANKSDEVIIIRPGTDPAFALGLAQVIMKEKLYDEEYVKSSTDLPLLIRMDTMKLLKAEDAIPGYASPAARRDTRVLQKGEAPPPGIKSEGRQVLSDELLESWGSSVVWDRKAGKPAAVTRDDVGKFFVEKGIDPELDAEKEILISGETVKVRSVYSVIRQLLDDSYDPDTVSKITWAPKEAIISLARQIAQNRNATLIATGMGPNQFFNADQKDRAIFLVCALTRNIGTHSGNIGSYAGNYRVNLYDGVGQYMAENPFEIEVDPAKPSKVKQWFKFESAHYYGHGDHPLRIGNKLFTGKTHIPTPTKSLMFANSNSILGNMKGHYEVVVNILPNIEMLTCAEWWWTASCENVDIVFAAHSWAERGHIDTTASSTNPFLQVFPRSPVKPLFETKDDIEIQAGIGKAIGRLINEPRFTDYWKFVHEDSVDTYLQRIMDASSMTKGYNVKELEQKAKEGVPALIMSRTYPKVVGWEQANESKQWYNRTGRLEFYRDEDEFIEYGENLPLHREPVDGTQYEPNVIVAKPHPCIKPFGPEKYDIPADDRSSETRQVRNIVMTADELLRSQHPLKEKHNYTHVYLTPKYRHAVHSTPVDVDMCAVWYGPFGDPFRKDKRTPWVGEGYVDINPEDAQKMGIEDGDYVWVDADPEDRPYHGEKKKGSEEYRLARLMIRARYYQGIPKSISRTWFHAYVATYGSVEGHLNNPDGLARNPRTGYQAMYRFGSHQSCTRSWLRPTLMTDTMVRKDTIGQRIGTGFAPDVHCPNGAPRESYVKFTKAEDGGADGMKLWRPLRIGLRPSKDNQLMKQFIQGGFVS